MTPQDVYDYFGGKADTARQLGLSYEAVRKWQEKGSVPEGRQAMLQLLTKGKLVADIKAA